MISMDKHRFSFLTVFLLFAAVFLLTACGKEETPPYQEPAAVNGQIGCRTPRPEMCTMQYEPACSNTGKTFSNGCTACSDPNVQYYTKGECQVEQVELADEPPADADEPGPIEEKPTIIKEEPEADEMPANETEGEVPAASTKDGCQSAGGKLKTVNGARYCDKKPRDAGSYCTRTTDCIGLCIAENKDSASGTCSPWHIVEGCVFYIENAKVVNKICE